VKHAWIRRLALITTFALPFLLVAPAYAASATLYLSPSSGSVANGNTLTLYVYEDSGTEPVNAVQANLSYPASQLQFLSTSSSSAFSVVAQNTGGSGSVQIGRGALPSVTGNQLVATVQFKALVGSGTAAVSFAGGSQVVSANSNANIMTVSPGGSYGLTTPAPSPTPSPSPAPTTSKSSSTTKATPAPAPSPAPAPKDTTPPVITDIAVSALTSGSATITWNTSEPASTEIDYGLTTGYGLVATDATLATSHSVVLNSPLIVPGTMYHFAIKNTDASGNRATSSDHQFTTKGATITLTIDDASGRPVKNAMVSFDSQTAITDASGHATIANLPIGNIVGTITIQGVQTVEVLRVTGLNPAGTPQEVSFRLAAHTSHTAWVTATIFVLCLLAAGWIGYMFGSGRLPMMLVRLRHSPRWHDVAPASTMQAVGTPVRPTVIAPVSAAKIADQNSAERPDKLDGQTPQRPTGN